MIELWEIGISQFLINHGMRCKTYINSQKYSREYYNGEVINVTIKLYKEMVKQGIPVIKKRVITNKKLPQIIRYKKSWEKLIFKYADEDFQPAKIVTELQQLRKIA